MPIVARHNFLITLSSVDGRILSLKLNVLLTFVHNGQVVAFACAKSGPIFFARHIWRQADVSRVTCILRSYCFNILSWYLLLWLVLNWTINEFCRKYDVNILLLWMEFSWIFQTFHTFFKCVSLPLRISGIDIVSSCFIYLLPTFMQKRMYRLNQWRCYKLISFTLHSH